MILQQKIPKTRKKSRRKKEKNRINAPCSSSSGGSLGGGVAGVRPLGGGGLTDPLKAAIALSKTLYLSVEVLNLSSDSGPVREEFPETERDDGGTGPGDDENRSSLSEPMVVAACSFESWVKSRFKLVIVEPVGWFECVRIVEGLSKGEGEDGGGERDEELDECCVRG